MEMSSNFLEDLIITFFMDDQYSVVSLLTNNVPSPISFLQNWTSFALYPHFFYGYKRIYL